MSNTQTAEPQVLGVDETTQKFHVLEAPRPVPIPKVKLRPLQQTILNGNVRPFIKRGNQLFAKFDTISIVHQVVGEKKMGFALYIYKGIEVSRMQVEGYEANSPLTLRGFQGEIPIKDMRPGAKA